MPELPATLLPHWRIDGIWTTLGPLRIGDGGEEEGRIQRDGVGLRVQTVFRDHQQRAYIPGSTLKGFLNSCLRSRLPESHCNAIFGYQAGPDEPGGLSKGMGGAISVWDARQDAGQLPAVVEEPDWRPDHGTCVAAHVAIQRRTGTAQEELLYHEEYVPAGVRFRVTILIEGGQLEGLDGERIAAILLGALQAGPRVGAASADGWGHLRWEKDATQVKRLTPPALRQWLANPTGPLVDALEVVMVAPIPLAPPNTPTPSLRFDISLRFHSPLLVNDTGRTRGKQDQKGTKPNHAGLREAADRPLLPASSVRGAMRSQAERIARTLAGGDGAASVHAAGDAPNVTQSSGLDTLDVVSFLFGAPGLRSPLQITSFHLAEGVTSGTFNTQEFIAIDRFTGGGADSLKFNAEGFNPSTAQGFQMTGSFTLDFTAWKVLERERSRNKPPDWSEVLRLLAYTLRDLCEGDITFGFGKAKGYGGCTAAVKATARNLGELDEDTVRMITTLFHPEKGV